MRAIVTGGTGFIGSHLIEALVARGDDVVCVGRPGGGRERGWLADLPVGYADVGVNDAGGGRLAPLLEGADVVFHLAGRNHARSAAQLYSLNTDGTACVVRAAAVHGAAAPHLVFASSIAAVGPCRDGGSLSPDSIPAPISCYGRSKILAEAVLHAFADRVPTTIVRLPSVYGPRDRGLFKLFRLIQYGVALTIGSWDREVSLIHVSDLVQGLLVASTRRAEASGRGRIYYLAHPEPVTWRAFARAAGEALGRDPLLVSVPAWLARAVALGCETVAALRHTSTSLNRERMLEIAQQRWVCDPSRAITELGFAPRITITQGLPETVAWYRDARWLPSSTPGRG